MPDYIYNKNQWDGKYHEVHQTNCPKRPRPENQVSLGWHASCSLAINYAEHVTGAHDFDGCAYCCAACHTG